MSGSPGTPRCPAGVAPATRGGAGGARSIAASASQQSATFVPDPPAGDQENGAAADWPLRSFLELGVLSGAVPCARLHARQVLWEWALTEVSDNTELLVSEIVTNAVAASQNTGQIGVVRLWLLSDGALVLILVWDPSLHPPVRVSADEQAESGRGLLLVDAISLKWGWYFPLNGARGKATWALLRADM